jgi:hypothetical protein
MVGKYRMTPQVPDQLWIFWFFLFFAVDTVDQVSVSVTCMRGL